MQLLIYFLPILCSFVVLGQIKREKWDNLRVTWGPDPQSPDHFVQLPTTEWDAVHQGFVKISDCDSTEAKWRGTRYIKDQDYGVVLLYDVTGYIAGLQERVPKDTSSIYPSAKIQPPFVDDGDFWVISAYFIEPSKICTTGRSATDFSNEGIGTNLYIQNSTSPESSVLIPALEADVRDTLWTKGKCFPTMGMHYWYDIRKDTPCDEIAPVFLLYNAGQLNAFGWSLITNLHSKLYEHPRPQVFGMFMGTVPSCLYDVGTITTMHIFLTNNVTLNQC